MIETILWTLLLGYLVVACIFIYRARTLAGKWIFAVLFFAPVAPWAVGHIVFWKSCAALPDDQVFERVTDVDGVLFSSNLGLDSGWIHWLVEKGGYQYAEYRAGKGYERSYWAGPGIGIGTDIRRTPQSVSNTRYEIERRVSTMTSSILRNDFVAKDRLTGKELGRKTLFFMSAGPLSRYLYWKLANNMDGGGYVCPSAKTNDDLLRFFPERVLVPAERGPKNIRDLIDQYTDNLKPIYGVSIYRVLLKQDPQYSVEIREAAFGKYVMLTELVNTNNLHRNKIIDIFMLPSIKSKDEHLTILDCKYKDTAVRNPNYKYDTFIFGLMETSDGDQDFTPIPYYASRVDLAQKSFYEVNTQSITCNLSTQSDPSQIKD